MHTSIQKKYPHSTRRRVFLQSVGAIVGAKFIAHSATAQAIWIQSSPLTLTVDDQGTGEGVVFAPEGNLFIVVSGLVPGFEAPGRFKIMGDAYFLTNPRAIAGDYHRIERTVDVRSINGLFGQKFQNQSGIVIFVTGPSNDEPLDPNIETITIDIAQ
jgi:hypothetical protein